MADWVNTALPIASLVTGSLLTIAGQTLRDKSLDKREQRARREQFRTANFGVHRTAMLEMQEIVRDFYDAVAAERKRRLEAGEYDFFDSRPFEKLMDHEARGAIEAIRDAPSNLADMSEKERKGFLQDMKSHTALIEQFVKIQKGILRENDAIFARQHKFEKRFITLVARLRLCMYRSASNPVVDCGEKYISAIFNWWDVLSSAGMEQRYEEVRTARCDLDWALANALAFGPYDKSTQKRSQSH